MSNYDNTNRISIWKNTKKETEKHPDYTGSVNIGGVDYFVDLWKKSQDAPEKAPVLSGKVKRKDKQPAQASREEDI